MRQNAPIPRTTSRSTRRGSTRQVLPLPTDVEHAAPERERDGEAREDQGGRDDERLLRFTAARDRTSSTFHGNGLSHRSTGARSGGFRPRRTTTSRRPRRSHDIVTGFLPVVAEQTAGTKNASTVVRSGAQRSLRRAARRCIARRRTAVLDRDLTDRRPSGGVGARRRSRSLHLPAAPRHRDPEPSLGRGRWNCRRSRLVHHENPIGEGEDLFELERHEEDAPPSSRSSTIRRWTNPMAPTSSPGLAAPRSAPSFRASSRASTTFCWLPPEQALRSGSSPRHAGRTPIRFQLVDQRGGTQPKPSPVACESWSRCSLALEIETGRVAPALRGVGDALRRRPWTRGVDIVFLPLTEPVRRAFRARR